MIATPKLVSILISDGLVKADHLKIVVVDAAEEMQDAGYTQVMLFSLRGLLRNKCS